MKELLGSNTMMLVAMVCIVAAFINGYITQHRYLMGRPYKYYKFRLFAAILCMVAGLGLLIPIIYLN